MLIAGEQSFNAPAFHLIIAGQRHCPKPYLEAEVAELGGSNEFQVHGPPKPRREFFDQGVALCVAELQLHRRTSDVPGNVLATD